MSKIRGNNYTKNQLDDHSRVSNPGSKEYKASMDNHANQMNPNNKEYKPPKK